MYSIFSKMLYEMEHNQDVVLVTVVARCGSAPRGAGARMLVGTRGRICGSIGGGAIEKRAEEMCSSVLMDRSSMVRDFTLRKSESGELGMVCGGDVTVLFGYVSAAAQTWKDLAENLLERLSRHEHGWLLSPLNDGMPALCDDCGRVIAGNIPDDRVSKQLRGTAPLLLTEAQVFAEPLSVGERVLIFGAGHIAQELSPILCRLNFRPIIFDDRQEYASVSLFPGAEAVYCGNFENFQQYLIIMPDDYIVVITNGHAHDREIQLQVMRCGQYVYLGVIGSRSKIEAVNKFLSESGISQELLDEVHTPVGISIGAITPAEIAVSIAAELIAVRVTRRDDVSKRRHNCPMH